MEVEDLAKYNDFKSNKIDEQKIIDLSKNCKNLEIINEEGKNYIKIKDFDETKLLTVQQILDNKKNQKMQKMQFNNAGNPPFAPYLNFQNNYIIYNTTYQPYPQYFPNPGFIYPQNK